MIDIIYFIREFGVLIFSTALVVFIVIRYVMKYMRAEAYREKYKATKNIRCAAMRFDMNTGLPMNVIGKQAIVEYYEDHFSEKLNDEVDRIGKNYEDNFSEKLDGEMERIRKDNEDYRR